MNKRQLKYVQMNIPTISNVEKPVTMGKAIAGWTFAIMCCIGFAAALVHHLSK